MGQAGDSTAFKDFCRSWVGELQQMVDQMRSNIDHETTIQLINRIKNHHSEFYRVKALEVDQNVLGLLTVSWASTLERTLYWMAGWRPTTVFHLLYSESSIVLEADIPDLFTGITTGDLADLDPDQMMIANELQCQTVKEENAITTELSDWQETASDLTSPQTNVEEKIGELQTLYRKADELRMRTMAKVMDLLTIDQMVDFIIAVVELQSGLRRWGIDRDRDRSRVHYLL